MAYSYPALRAYRIRGAEAGTAGAQAGLHAFQIILLVEVKAAFYDLIRRLKGFPGISATRVYWFSPHVHRAKTAFPWGGFFIIILINFLPQRALIHRPHEKT